MGIFDAIAGIGTAIIGSQTGAADSAMDMRIAQMNMQQQRRVQSWEQNKTKETWNREDTAMQRKVADLKASGLSPVLAAGGAGSPTSNAPKLTVPQLSPRKIGSQRSAERAALVMSMMQQKADVGRTVAQKDLIEAQKNAVDVDTMQKGKMNPLIAEEKKLKVEIDRIVQKDRVHIIEDKASISLVNKQIAKLGIVPAEVKAMKAIIQRKNIKLDPRLAMQELVAKQLAIDLGKHNLEILRKLKIPSTWRAGSLGTIGLIAGSNIGNWLKGKKGQMDEYNPFDKKY